MTVSDKLRRFAYKLLPTSTVFKFYCKYSNLELRVLNGNVQMHVDRYDRIADDACALANVLRTRGVAA